MDNKKYNTKQKNELLEFFKENKDKCFLAKDIIKNSSISLGEATVYRTLSRFVEEGVLKKFISPGGGGAYYQYNEKSHGCDSHFHLKCVKCGTLFHMEVVGIHHQQLGVRIHFQEQLVPLPDDVVGYHV